MKGIIFFTTAQNIMRSPQTQWDILCPVITSVEVSDFPLGRGMNKGRTGVCLSMRVSVFLWVFLVCQRGGGAVLSSSGKSEKTQVLRRKSLPIRGKQA